MNREELRKARDAARARIAELRKLDQDEKHTWTAENEKNWQEANTAYDTANAGLAKLNREDREAVLIEADKRQDALDAGEAREADPRREEIRREILSQVPDPEKDPNRPLTVYEQVRRRQADESLALRAWVGSGFNVDGDAEFEVRNTFQVSDAQKAACKRLRVNPRRNEFEMHWERDYRAVRARCLRFSIMKEMEQRAAAMSLTATAGGEVVPEGFSNQLEVALLAFGGMRQVAQVVRTTEGNNLPWPTFNDTAQTGRLVSEAAAIVDGTTPVTGEVVYGAFKYSSDFIKISYELLNDSAFDMDGIIGEAIGIRVGRIQNTHFTVGDGSSKPRGLMIDTVAGVTAASATAITANELLDLAHAVNSAYRTGARYMFEDLTLKVLRKLQDSTGRQLWQDAVADGAPGTIHGYGYQINDDMAAVAASQKSVAFGALNAYKIRDAGNIRLKRLEERFADNDQTAFLGLLRSDGALLDAGGAPIKHLIQAA